MIKLENFEVMGWEHALRGMRNPMNSWDRSDSDFKGTAEIDILDENDKPDKQFVLFDALGIGPNDHELMMKLAKGGSVHAKYRRMITVYVDITAPLYWWKEFDTYKVGTVANSCSTMHRIHEKEFTLEDFSCEHLLDSYLGEDSEANMDVCEGDWTPMNVLDFVKDALNHYRKLFLETKTKPLKDESARQALMKKYWWQMIQLLPSSYNQKRTVMFNYEVLAHIYKDRRHHKMGEDHWDVICEWIEQLPYSEVITGV